MNGEQFNFYDYSALSSCRSFQISINTNSMSADQLTLENSKVWVSDAVELNCTHLKKILENGWSCQIFEGEYGSGFIFYKAKTLSFNVRISIYKERKLDIYFELIEPSSEKYLCRT